jgi:predicted Zn-dependent protease
MKRTETRMKISEKRFVNFPALLATVVLALALGLGFTPLFGDENYGSSPLGRLQGRADEAISIGGQNPNYNMAPVFEYAMALRSGGQDDISAQYLQKGLEIYPWSLEDQLVLAHWYSKNKNPKKALEGYRFVKQFAETDALRQEALKGLGEAPETVVTLDPQPVAGKGPVVLLVPLGPVEQWLQKKLADEVHEDLGVPVSWMSLGITLGEANRDPYQGVLGGLREGAKGDPGLSASIKKAAAAKGVQEPALWEGETFLPFFLQTLRDSGKGDAADQVALLVSQVKGRPLQWDGDQLMNQLKDKSKTLTRPGAVFVGVTGVDIGSDGLAFQFGAAVTGTGLISYHRFTSKFNHETPNQLRLLRRSEKQALSSIGFTYGVVRCQTPWCTRAYPNSLEEHDVKENKLCAECVGNFEKAFAVFGWTQPIPPKIQKAEPAFSK